MVVCSFISDILEIGYNNIKWILAVIRKCGKYEKRFNSKDFASIIIR